MKVTISNLTDRPINISRLAPLMPTQVLGVKQEIKVNVKDIESVIAKATEIGVTVTPMETIEVTHVVDDPNNDETSSGEVNDEGNSITEDDSKSEDEKVEETDPKSEIESKPEVIEEKSKKKSGRKSSKKSITKKLFGNN